MTTPSMPSAGHEVRLRIPVRAPFDWSHSLAFLRGFPPTRNEQLVDGEQLIKAWRLEECAVIARIGATDDGALEATLASSDPLSEPARRAAADRLSFYLSVDDDLRAFHRTAAQDPAFAPIAARLRGYHQVKFGTPVENLVWSILAQRTPLRVAHDAKLRLMRHLNPPIEGFGAALLPFPSLPQLVTVTEEDLAQLIGNQRKARYLHAGLRRLLDIDESFLRTADLQEVQDFLLSLPGIGPWSAVFVLIRGLGRMQVLPEEPELLRAAQRCYGPGLTMADLRPLAAAYAPQQGYWAHYLRVGA